MSGLPPRALTSLLAGKLQGTEGQDLKLLEPGTHSRSFNPGHPRVSQELFTLNTLV